MAMLCASTAVIFLSSSSPSSQPRLSFLPSASPFLGFSVGKSTASLKTTLAVNAQRAFQVRCQEKDLSVVPLNQRWMFEQSEVNGPDIWNSTWYPKTADHLHRDKTWYVVDATDKILGRLASTIAIHIRGKDLATYTPSVDMGAYVIVVNAEKVAVSGKKRSQKLYRRHSGRPGGMKVETFDQLQQRIPERIIEHAVRGMLPKGRCIPTNETNSSTTKRSRRKKTFAELKEEESMLMKERIHLKKEIETLRATFKEQSARNEDLKRMKVGLELHSANNSSETLEVPQKAIPTLVHKGVASSLEHIPSTLPTHSMVDLPQTESCEAHEAVSARNSLCLLPDLNMTPSEDDSGFETLYGMS